MSESISSAGAPVHHLTFWRRVKLHLQRAFAWDLQLVGATEREQSKLQAAGINQETLHRYAVWRRSVLLIVIVPTLLAAILATLSAADDLATPDTSTDPRRLSLAGKALILAGTLVIWVLPVSAFLAVRSWASLRASHRALIAGWTFSFIPPFLIALVPMSWWYVLPGAPEQREQFKQKLAVLDILDGLYVTFTLLPTALAVLPGVVRACLRVKTLMPASLLPGWFLMVAPPFYLLLAIVALVALNHVAGSPLLILGVLFAIGAPMVYVWRADLFVRPLQTSDCAAIDRAQRVASVVFLLGVVLLLAYLFTKEIFGLRLVGLDAETSLVWMWQNRDLVSLKPGEALSEAHSFYWLGDISLSQVFIQYFGRSLFMTTVFADLLVRVSLSIWGQEKQFAGTPAASAYDEVMLDLKQALTANRSRTK